MEVRGSRGEPGYAMVALLVGLSVMAIALSTALPVYQTVARREREAELVFRGEQYARAIALFQRKYANALPPTVDALLAERFLRKKYKDPITGEDFRLLGPGSPELAEALSAPPEQARQVAGTEANARGQRGRGAAGRGALGRGSFGLASGQTGRGTAGAETSSRLGLVARETAGAQAGGGILAVASTSAQASFRLYNGKGRYNEWVFMALQASRAAGAPAGTGAQAPGGRGGAGPAGGRGGNLPGGFRGRGTMRPTTRGAGRGPR